MSKLIVVYRDNDLFSSYVPQILGRVPKGVEVKTYIYPVGTNPVAIANDMATKIATEQPPYLFLSDWTCSPYQLKGMPIADTLTNPQVRKLERLDYHFQQATRRSFGEDYALALQKIAQAFVTELREICIVEQSICDHLEEYDDLYEQFGLGSGPDRQARFAAYIKSKLEEVFPQVPTNVAARFDQSIEELARKTNSVLLVADRHASGYAVMSPDRWLWKHLTLLRLPLSNAIGDLVMMGKIGAQFDTEQLYQQIFAGTDLVS
jgi:hypothetical protein